MPTTPLVHSAYPDPPHPGRLSVPAAAAAMGSPCGGCCCCCCCEPCGGSWLLLRPHPMSSETRSLAACCCSTSSTATRARFAEGPQSAPPVAMPPPMAPACEWRWWGSVMVWCCGCAMGALGPGGPPPCPCAGAAASGVHGYRVLGILSCVWRKVQVAGCSASSVNQGSLTGPGAGSNRLAPRP